MILGRLVLKVGVQQLLVFYNLFNLRISSAQFRFERLEIRLAIRIGIFKFAKDQAIFEPVIYATSSEY